MLLLADLGAGFDKASTRLQTLAFMPVETDFGTQGNQLSSLSGVHGVLKCKFVPQRIQEDEHYTENP